MGRPFFIIFAEGASIREMESLLDQVVLGQKNFEESIPPKEINLGEDLGIPNLFPDRGVNRLPK